MSETPTAPAFAEEVMLLAEKLGELNERLAKAEADLATQTAPLDATKAAQDATLAALSAALSGIKALNFHVLGNDLGAVSKRVESVENLQKAEAVELATMIGRVRERLDEAVAATEKKLAALESGRTEFSQKRDADVRALAEKADRAELQQAVGALSAELAKARTEFAAMPTSFNPRGEWDAQATYARLDVVTLNGTSYVSQVDGNSDKPGKASKSWQVLARRGSGGGGGISAGEAVGRSEAAAAAAAASEAAAAASAASASTSADEAASSATTALNAIASTYKGGAAGGSVPATSTAAGDYYRITSAGTSQSVTWTTGDLAIYNGTSGSWTQIAAGFIDEARVLSGDVPRQISDCLFSDGVSGSRRGEATFGAVGAVAGLPMSFLFEFEVPTSNPSANIEVFAMSPTGYAGTSLANGMYFRARATGALSLYQFGATIPTDFRNFEYAGFRAAYSGILVRGAVVFTAGDSTTDPEIYLQGVNVSASFSATSGGTAPNWMPTTLDATKFLSCFNFTQGRFSPGVPIVGALTSAEVIAWTKTGRLPAWCNVGTGSATAATSGTLTTGRKYRLKDFIAGDDFTNVGAGSNADGVEFVATASTPTTWTNSSEVLTLGPLARWEVQPLGTCYDAGRNKIPLLLTGGISPITNRRDWVLQGQTNTNGNQQLLAASVFVAPYDYTRHMLDSIETNGTSTATVGVGSASGGAQYVTAAALASGRNRRTLVTPVPASANIWVSANATDTLQHTIRGHIAD